MTYMMMVMQWRGFTYSSERSPRINDYTIKFFYKNMFSISVKEFGVICRLFNE
jgi:hypothetical protein